MKSREILDPSDAAMLLTFILSPAGARVVDALKARKPKFFNPADVAACKSEAVALQASHAQGWEDCIEEILSIAHDRTEEGPASGYLQTDLD